MKTSALKPKKIANDIRKYLNRFNLFYCLTYGTCTKGYPITENPKAE